MCHVLVIEDEWLIADHFGSLAERAGASSIDYAATEDEAIRAALRTPPAIILSDVRLAKGTGPAAVAAIRSKLGPIPTIFVTRTPAACEPCDFAEAIIAKPIIDRQVLDHLRRVAEAAG
jgi:CheY-like chemotaxis protein